MRNREAERSVSDRGQRSRPVPHEIHAALLLLGTLGVTSTACGRGQVLTACWPAATPIVEAAMGRYSPHGRFGNGISYRNLGPIAIERW